MMQKPCGRRKGKKVTHTNISGSMLVTEHLSNFDKSFKYYKKRCPPPDLSQLFVLDNPNTWGHYEVKQIPVCDINEEECQAIGLEPLSTLHIAKFVSKPGLLFISNPFTPEGQQKWASHCLEDYTCSPPYKLNLDAHQEWNTNENSKQWWDLCCNMKSELRNTLRKKLRWATLGYHHNWDTKVYSEENRGTFPTELANLSRLLAQATGFPDFHAEAAIVNFYHMDSTLAGHKDHSEQDHTAPLLSVSFGQRAIFLIGGHNKDELPLALLLQSGDVIIMSGESRLSYHGVPRILPTSNSHVWGNDQGNSDGWVHCHDYLCNSRINLNIRQVLPVGNKMLIP